VQVLKFDGRWIDAQMRIIPVTRKSGGFSLAKNPVSPVSELTLTKVEILF